MLVSAIKRPPQAMAAQYTGDNLEEFAKAVRSYVKAVQFTKSFDKNEDTLVVGTGVDQKIVHLGDWVVMVEDVPGFQVMGDYEFQHYFEIVPSRG